MRAALALALLALGACATVQPPAECNCMVKCAPRPAPDNQ